MKKITGEAANDHYIHVSPDGQVYDREAEYTTMSRRPGVGAPWLEKFKTDVYPDDFIVLDNRKMRVPRFYDGLLEKHAEDEIKKIKRDRKKSSHKHKENNTPARLKTREKIQLHKLNQLKRNLD